MSDVVEARELYNQVRKDARGVVALVRLHLGKTIADAREAGLSQDAIKRELGLTREQVRRFQDAYEKALTEKKLSPVELAFAVRIAQTLAGSNELARYVTEKSRTDA